MAKLFYGGQLNEIDLPDAILEVIAAGFEHIESCCDILDDAPGGPLYESASLVWAKLYTEEGDFIAEGALGQQARPKILIAKLPNSSGFWVGGKENLKHKPTIKRKSYFLQSNYAMSYVDMAYVCNKVPAFNNSQLAKIICVRYKSNGDDT